MSYDFDPDDTAVAIPEKTIVPFDATVKALDVERGATPAEWTARQKAFESFIWSTQQMIAPPPGGEPKAFNKLAGLSWRDDSLNSPISLETQAADHLATHPIKHTVTARLTAPDMLRILSCPLFFARTVEQDWPIMLGGAAFLFPGQVETSEDSQAQIDATAADTTWRTTFTSTELSTAAIVVSRGVEVETTQVPYFVKLRKVIVSGERLLKRYEALSKDATAQKAALPAGVSADLVTRFATLSARATSVMQATAPSACAFVLYECAMFDVPSAPTKAPMLFDEILKGRGAAPFRAHVVAQKNRYTLTLTVECRGTKPGAVAKFVISMQVPFISNAIYNYLKPLTKKAVVQTIANTTSEFAVGQTELGITLPAAVTAPQKTIKIEQPHATTTEKRKHADVDEQQQKKKGTLHKNPDKVPPKPPATTTLETQYAIGTEAYKASCINLTEQAGEFAQAMLASNHSYAERYGSAVQTLHNPPNDAAKAQAQSDVDKALATINYLGVLPEFIAACKSKHVDPPPPLANDAEPELF